MIGWRGIRTELIYTLQRFKYAIFRLLGIKRNVSEFSSCIFPVVRAKPPIIRPGDILKVQPLDAPLSQVFYMEYRYFERRAIICDNCGEIVSGFVYHDLETNNGLCRKCKDSVLRGRKGKVFLSTPWPDPVLPSKRLLK